MDDVQILQKKRVSSLFGEDYGMKKILVFSVLVDELIEINVF